MKICVLGLDCAAPEILLQDERLVHIRDLMRRSIYGRLESVIPPITVPAWMCMCTSLDPGTLGVYGFRNRSDYSYSSLSFVTSRSIQQPAIWDELARADRKSIIIGIPPSFPPRRINGINIGCFLTPDPARDEFTFPSGIGYRLNKLVDGYRVDVKGFRTDDKAWLKDQIFEMSRKQWRAVHWLLREQEWDYFHFVDIGLDRVHHGFWNFFDRKHRQYVPGNEFEQVIPDYYLWLDAQIGQVLEMLDRDTVVLVVSDHGAQRLDGGFAINEWLIREGLLALKQYPREVTPFNKLDIDWSKTKVWSEGGYYARVFFNIRGREPEGVIPAGDYDAFQDEMKSHLEALEDDCGAPLHSLVFKPAEIYGQVNGIAPDLIVHLGGLYWRSIGSVGRPVVHVQENDTGPDACNHAQFGAFILSIPNSTRRGEFEGARLLDIAPTLLRSAGYEIPARMQGRVL
jgi:predicted AlkP superfamily phosphohydrolase/phosphomutase